MIVDLQAHGENPGTHITIGHLEKHDARAAVECARQEHPNQPIGVVAMSLGGAASLIVSPLELDALELKSLYPIANDAILNRVSIKFGPLSTIPVELLLVQLKPRLVIWSSQLRPIDHLPDVDCPVYMISGVKDRHATARETKQMLSATRQPKEMWLVDGAAHVDVYHVSSLEYKDRVVGVLDKCIQR